MVKMEKLKPMRQQDLVELIGLEDDVKVSPPQWHWSATPTTENKDQREISQPKRSKYANDTNPFVRFVTTSPIDVLQRVLSCLENPLRDGSRVVSSCKRLHTPNMWKSVCWAAFPQWNQRWRPQGTSWKAIHEYDALIDDTYQAVAFSDLLGSGDFEEFSHGFGHIACHLVNAWASLTNCGVLRTDYLHQRLLKFECEGFDDVYETTPLLKRVGRFGKQGFNAFLNEDGQHILRGQQLKPVTSDDQVASAIEDWRELTFLLRLKQRLEALQLYVPIGDGGEAGHWFLVRAPWLRGASAWSKKDFLQAILCPINKDLFKSEEQEAEDEDDEQDQDADGDGEEDGSVEQEDVEVATQQEREQESSAETLRSRWAKEVEKHECSYWTPSEDALDDDGQPPQNSQSVEMNAISVKKIMDRYLHGTRVFWHQVACCSGEEHFVMVGLSSTGHFLGFTEKGWY